MKGTIVIGRTLGYTKYSTELILAVVILWLVTSLLISPRNKYRLEQTCAISVGILTPLVVPALMAIGLRGEEIDNPWYYFGLIISVCVAIITGYMAIRDDFGRDSDDIIWRFINLIVAILLNIGILIMCF
jgi:hypothetical protein